MSKETREAVITEDTHPLAATEIPHAYVRGVWLWGQHLCKVCYCPFYYDVHSPSFGRKAEDNGVADAK